MKRIIEKIARKIPHIMNNNLLQDTKSHLFRPILLSFYEEKIEKEYAIDYFNSSKVSLRFGVVYTFIVFAFELALAKVQADLMQLTSSMTVITIIVGIMIIYLSYKAWFAKYFQVVTIVYGFLIFAHVFLLYFDGFVFSSMQISSLVDLDPMQLINLVMSVFLYIICFYSFMRLRFVYSAGLLVTISIVFTGIITTISGYNQVYGMLISYLFLINIFGLLLSHRLEYYSRRQFLLTKSIFLENERSESLLLNVLPKEIAQRLKGKEDNIVDEFDEATVLFCDICGFTPLSSNMPPKELVQLLNMMFSEFDKISEKYGIEKIKTMGDCYMSVAGIPIKTIDHAETMAKVAIEMKSFVQSMDYDLNVRIGIHSGPVVAGVIGVKKFIYDLWGDTVNIAARMESHSINGQIQVSKKTYEIIKGKFTFEDRGFIEIKGKGKMQTYFLKSE